VQAIAAIFVWFTVWNDYGLNAAPLFGKANLWGFANALKADGKFVNNPFSDSAECLIKINNQDFTDRSC